MPYTFEDWSRTQSLESLNIDYKPHWYFYLDEDVVAAYEASFGSNVLEDGLKDAISWIRKNATKVLSTLIFKISGWSEPGDGAP
jgi:hypothetical protein